MLQADDLTALSTFMTASLHMTSSRGLIDLALAAVQRQTQADVCGFLSFAPEDPLPRLVRPAQAAVDIQLSRRLTQRAQRKGTTARLEEIEPVRLDGDSLASYRDGLCLPLRASPGGGVGETTLGALHV